MCWRHLKCPCRIRKTHVLHSVAAAPFLANARVLDAALFPSHCAPKAAIVVATVAAAVAAVWPRHVSRIQKLCSHELRHSEAEGLRVLLGGRPHCRRSQPLVPLVKFSPRACFVSVLSIVAAVAASCARLDKFCSHFLLVFAFHFPLCSRDFH